MDAHMCVCALRCAAVPERLYAALIMLVGAVFFAFMLSKDLRSDDGHPVHGRDRP